MIIMYWQATSLSPKRVSMYNSSQLFISQGRSLHVIDRLTRYGFGDSVFTSYSLVSDGKKNGRVW